MDNNKKNILLLSTIYPKREGNKGTPVCHYFAKEWKAMGYNVRVVHIQSVYPLPFYWMARVATKRIAAKTGAVVYTKRDKREDYVLDGVSVMFYPLFKKFPHGKYSAKAIHKMIDDIITCNNEYGFKPDYILGHFINPCLEVVSALKEHYQEAASSVIVHGDLNQIHDIYGGGLFEKFSKNIDCWGFRGKPVFEGFEREVGKVHNPYYCYSGIPKSMLMDKCEKSFEHPLCKFIYIGEFIARKHPIIVAKALHEVYPDGNFQMTYVGQGGEMHNVKDYLVEQNLLDKVTFTGKIPRSEITGHLDVADCFVMVSQGEAFGLVYLEAMSRGCITIATRNDGVDGIIIDGENGFLCKAGDAGELASIIKRINAMTAEQRKAISEAGRKVVAELTDKKVAKMYIDSVESYKNQD